MGSDGFAGLHPRHSENIGIDTAPRPKGDGAVAFCDETDWAEVFAAFYANTGLSRSDVLDMSIPEIDAILPKLHKYIEIKIGVPGLFGPASAASGTSGTTAAETGPMPNNGELAKKPPKISEIISFVQDFSKSSHG